MIRLPEAFRSIDAETGDYSRDVYLANLVILEAAIKNLERLASPSIDETKVEWVNGAPQTLMGTLASGSVDGLGQ